MSKDMKDSLKEVGAKVGSAIDDMKDKAQDAMDQAKEKGQDLKDQASKHFDKAKDTKDQAGQHFEDFAGVAEDEFSRLYGSDNKLETLTNFVRDRPVVALVIAMVFGTIVSKLFRCCCKRRKCK